MTTGSRHSVLAVGEGLTVVAGIDAGGQPDTLCVLVVNPGLEQVLLTRTEGTWQVSPRSDLLQAGMKPPGEAVIAQPIAGAVARLGDDLIAITKEALPPKTWD